VSDRLVHTEDRDGIAQLGAVLAAAGYTARAVERVLTADGERVPRTADALPLQLRLLPPGERLSTLVALFYLGVSVPTADAEAALAPLALERLAAMGLVETGAAETRALVDLVPTEELLVASDRFEGGSFAEDREEVLGLTPPTRALASLTIRRPVDSALDLGTGSGVLAILAADHARHVVGLDVNPRALALAELNALLNGRHNVEWRRGDWLEAVTGETFDLIVCNPPYLISPDRTFTFRDNPLPGDAFCAELVRRTPAHLAPGGLAHLLVSWGHRNEEEWSAPLRRWADGIGCDAILLRYASEDPLSHAAEWNEALRGDREAFGATLDRWTAYCAELGIERIGWGTVVLRRREGSNWVFALTSSGTRIAPAGHHLERLMAAQDRLEAADGDGLLDDALALADDHRLDRSVRLGGGVGVLEGAFLRLEGGLGTRIELDPALLEVVGSLDGRRALRDVLEPLAESEAWARSAMAAVTRLFELGFLVRA
jgi:methylase of polypeptide subunit release factors